MGARESKSRFLSCRLEGRDAIHEATEAGRLFYADTGLSAADGARLVIVIEELVTNLIEHGGVTFDDIIELTLAGDDQGVMIVLDDPGVPFDLREAASPDDLPPERDGGVGLDLVRAWAEILDYRSDAGRNRLELRMVMDE